MNFKQSKKKIYIGLIIVVILIFVVGVVYFFTEKEKQAENTNRNPKEIYGTVISVSDKDIKIKELLNKPCFYIMDYDDSGLTQDEANKKYNLDNLPNCPVDGYYFENTENKLSINFDLKTIFYLIKQKGGGMGDVVVSKDEFVKGVMDFSKGTYDKVQIIFDGSMVKEVKQLYED